MICNKRQGGGLPSYKMAAKEAAGLLLPYIFVKSSVVCILRARLPVATAYIVSGAEAHTA